MAEIIKCVILFVILTIEVKWNSGYSDYRSVVRENMFVDKTLLMKELGINDGIINIINAPKGFGKSTNVDMIRRFFQFNAGKKGKLLKAADTKNFNLFKTNSLSVYKDWDFFGVNFQSRPILYVDFGRIHRAQNFPAAVQMFKKVVWNSYKRHSYLLRVKELWSGDFKVEHYLDVLRDCHQNLTMIRLEHAFEYLSKLLYAHFKRKVYVILDEYDAFAHVAIYRRATGVDNIITLFSTAIRYLLVSNPAVKGALLTGVLNVMGKGLIELGNNVQYYPFLGNHKFLNYFGITEVEAVQLIRKVTKENKHERDRLMKILGHHYRGYRNTVTNFTIFDTSLMKLFLIERNENLMGTHKEYLIDFSVAMRFPTIYETMLRVLHGESITVDVSKQLSKTDLLLMNKLHTASNFDELQRMNISLNAYFYFLLQMGYLMPKEILTNSTVSAITPTMEREERLVETLMDKIEGTYECHADPTELYAYINKIRSGRKSKLYFYNEITRWIQRLILEGRYVIENTTESLRNVIHLFLRYGIQNTYVQTRRPLLKSNEILMENTRGTSFLIRVEFVHIYDKIERFEFTKNIIRQMLLENRTNILQPKARESIVYFGISYYIQYKITSVAYSLHVNKDDNPYDIQVISKHERDLFEDLSTYYGSV